MEKLADGLYHRSATLFFVNHLPEEPTVYGEFRQLPASVLNDLHPDTLYAVRQARARQYHLRLLAPAQDASMNDSMLSLRNRADPGDPHSLVKLAQQCLERNPDKIVDPQKGAESTSYWREWVEDAGVWVFLRGFKQEDVAGFCLWEYRFPVIYVNNALSRPRMSATILRQFSHLLFDFNHIERTDESHYLSFLSGEALAIEQACNDFVKEFVDVPGLEKGQSPTITSRNGGGNFHAVQADRLGRKYLRAAFLAFEDERIDEAMLSSVLGVKAEQIDNLESFAWQGEI